MKNFVNWLRDATVKLVDPERQARIEWLSRKIDQEIARKKASFNLTETTAELQIAQADLREATIGAYERAARRAWSDRNVTSRQRAALSWIAGSLELTKEQTLEIEERMARQMFEQAMSDAFADGELSDHEAQLLQSIAAGLDISAGEMIRRYFSAEGEGFLRAFFNSLVHDDEFTEADWHKLQQAVERLGLSPADLRQAIAPQAETYIEHVLADAKSDGRLSEAENDTLRWLLDRLPVRPSFVKYVKEQITELKLLTDISEGRLPSVPGSGFLKSGEITHYYGHCVYVRTRYLKNGSSRICV